MSEARGYVIITPVRDEDRYIDKTLKSVLRQTVRPVQWIIVDDGSTDSTVDIVRDYSEKHEWIELVMGGGRPIRNTGSAEIDAFNRGHERLNGFEYDFIVKLDGDVTLPKDYFQRLIERFNEDERLGIASGVYCENHGQGWQPVVMPNYHAAGASKMVRRACFEDIGGFLNEPGWDTVDEIKAQFRGWQTRHFEDVKFYHLKNEGTGMGYKKTNMMHGEIYFLTGGSKAIFLLKFIRRLLLGKPAIKAGAMLFYGYLKAMAAGKKPLLTDEEAQFYRRLLRKRLIALREYKTLVRPS